jgi:hypothetical protein
MGQKKYPYQPKKGPLGTRGFGTYFWIVDLFESDFERKNPNSYCSSEGMSRWNKKSTPSSQKKVC